MPSMTDPVLTLPYEEFKQELDRALAEIEYASNQISDLGNGRLNKLNNTFVLLTVLGYVPAAMANLEFLEEPYYAFILCITLLAACTVYCLYYIMQYYAMPELLRYLAHKVVDSANATGEDDRFYPATSDVQVKVLRETKETAKEARMTYMSLTRRRNVVDGACQIIICIISLVLVVLLIQGEKTEEFQQPQLAELVFTIWMFVANIVLALLYAHISTRKRDKRLQQTANIAENVAKDWLDHVQQEKKDSLLSPSPLRIADENV
ncbi:hypothetical protein LRAMOSA04415 [Lichtheimia ramosa]|uniref:Uncharacterized protein n=1 Tax=Lichtheimia ramosa TaxID=688394 RepID=A0A077WY77_9FUNG|nr:hypothetical protein LRAMOSA04415 [Lichtheimia ramosa]